MLISIFTSSVCPAIPSIPSSQNIHFKTVNLHTHFWLEFRNEKQPLEGCFIRPEVTR